MKRLAPWGLKGVFFAGLAAFGFVTTAAAVTTPRIKPPAPGPTYLSKADHDQLLSVADALKKKQFSRARNKAALVVDPIAKSLGTWMYFMAEDPKVDMKAADAFLDAHPGWPAVRRIQSFVEKRISDNAPADDVLSLFQSRDPVTGEGKIQLARAHYTKGAKEAGDRYLRDAWINHNFRLSKERKILSSYGERLTKEDHAARVDRLLWGRQVTNARRVIPRLSGAKRREAQARSALLMRASSGPSLYRKLSADQQLDSGVLHAAVRYYRRSGDEQFAISLAEKSPSDPDTLRNSGRWWDERQLLMRWALREGRFGDAYAAAAMHGLEPGGDYAEAEFNAGWIALRFLNEPARAEKHFLALASAVGTPISISRAYYWLGRSAAARKDADLAKTYYQVAARHYYSYYGQLAAEELGGAALTRKFAAPAQSSADDRALFSSRPTVAALRRLSDLNLDYEFMVFAYHVDDQLQRPGEFIELAKLTNGEGAPHLTVRAGKAAIQKDAFAPDVAYPLVFVPDEAARFISPEIVLGLSRQESEFNPRAFSHAGARGLMQLVPATAQMTARKEGLRYSRSALLDDPVYNMTIGSAHLSHLVSRFDGSLIMAFASYNAGQNRVDRWMREYGDPREAKIDPVDWVELIPFSETRNYVQRVLENVQVYRGRLTDAPIPGRLSSDLERGGSNNRVAQAPEPAIITVSTAPRALAPLPDRTAKRADEYASLTMASIIMGPQQKVFAAEPVIAEEKPAARSPRNRRSRRPRRRARNVVAENNTPPAAPAASVAEIAQVSAPKPVIESATSLPEAKPVAENILTAGNTVVTSNAVKVAVNETLPTETPIEKRTEKSVGPSPAAVNSALAKEPPEDADATQETAAALPLFPPVITSVPATAGASAPAGDAETLDVAGPAQQTTPLAPPTFVQPPGEQLAVVASALAAPIEETKNEPEETEECLAYRAFLAEIAENDAEAEDLNALMLSELQSGACS